VTERPELALKEVDVHVAESNSGFLLHLRLVSPAGCLLWKPEISTGPYGP